MNIFNVITMLGGLALFLYGMRIMGDGLKRSSSGAFKTAIEKLTSNTFKSFILGLLLTAVIQSSTATIVITAGLVGAGVITLHQSLGIIIGANVGTTVTGQIIRLLDVDSSGAAWLEVFKPSTLAPIAAVIGIIFIIGIKSKNSETVGTIAMGFGILFTGLLSMTSAVTMLSSSPEFVGVLTEFGDSPFLGFLTGTVVAFILQSASATVGILQTLTVTGKMTFASVYPILLGIFMGDCITTAIVCAIGAKADPKRTGIIHIIFNICSAILVVAAVSILAGATPLLDSIWDAPMNSGGIANTNTIFKLGCALLLLPLANTFEKLSRKIVKDDASSKNQNRLDARVQTLNRALYKSPALALAAAYEAVTDVAEVACRNAESGLSILTNYDKKQIEQLDTDEDFIDTVTDQTSEYLIGLSPHISGDTDSNEKLNYYMKMITEFERIGDHAVNLTENAEDLVNGRYKFSDDAIKEFEVVSEALREIMGYAREAFTEDSMEAARRIEPVEEVIDDLVAVMRENHMNRLKKQKCSSETGLIFMEILTNIERISDQCSNIGVATMGMHDKQIATMQHDYLRSLHSGTDEIYNHAYAQCKAYYFGRLQ